MASFFNVDWLSEQLERNRKSCLYEHGATRYSAAMEMHAKALDEVTNLLGPNDPPVFDHINADGAAHLVLICDHAGRSVPGTLNGLGVDVEHMERHIAYDIGAAAVTRRMSELLDAPALLHNYSRLVIDCNRPLGHPESISEISDRTTIPANVNIREHDALKRVDTLFWPYHQAISNVVGHRWRVEGCPPVLFSVHSFTPSFGDEHRPWDAGVLYNRDPRLAHPMMEALREQGLHIGDNQPYSGLEAAYSIDVHGTSPGLANGVIEIRQDQISDAEGQERWAQILARSLYSIMKREDIHRVQRY